MRTQTESSTSPNSPHGAGSITGRMRRSPLWIRLCDGLQHNTDVTARFYNQSSQLGASWTLLVAISFGLSIMVLASATLHTRHA